MRHPSLTATCLLALLVPAASGLAADRPASAPVLSGGDATDLPSSLAKGHELARALEKAFAETRQPLCEIAAIVTASGLRYAPRADGAWLAQSPNQVPKDDTLTVTLKSKDGGARIHLDFPIDPSLPQGKAGLASNGNFALTGVSVTVGGRPVGIIAVRSETWENQFKPANLLKPADDKEHEWNPAAHVNGPVALELDLAGPVPTGAEAVVRLECKSRWNQHQPGCIAAATIGGVDAARSAAALATMRTGFDAWCDKVEAIAERGNALGAATGSPDSQAALARAELLRTCGRDGFWRVITGRDGLVFLQTFLADAAWVESFLLGGQEGTGTCDYAQSLENLRLLWSQLPRSAWNDPVSKRLGTAIALEAGTFNRYRLVERFRLVEQARAEGRLHAGFDRLDVRAMRHAVNISRSSTPYEFEAWLDETQFTAGGYVGACWGVRYVTPSVYGHSVQAWGFYEPLRHALPMAKLYRALGGVCGSLSTFGAVSAQTHGVPSFTVGQPAHCAYVVRIGDHWATGNDVFGPNTNSWSAYDSIGFNSTDALLEKTENAKEYPAAQRQLWAARTMQAVARPSEVWTAAYEAALRTQPTNYAAWMEYTTALEKEGKTTPSGWFALADQVAKNFQAHQEAGWALILRCLQNSSAQLATPAARANKLLKFHPLLSQKAVPTMYPYDANRVLDRQADFIGDDAVAVDFFGKLLAIHYSDQPNLNWVFGAVTTWGNDRFSKHPTTGSAYAKAIGGFFADQRDKADKGQVAKLFAQGLQKAAESGDATAYRTWQDLAKKLLPPSSVLTPEQMAKRPALPPFPGTLLSATGMLRLSKPSGADRPLSYACVLDGSAPGQFGTEHEEKPWAQVVLAGDGELSGIVLASCYDSNGEKAVAVPFKVETSTDGKAWSQVALFDQPQDVYRVDLQGKGVRAKFVRIERQKTPTDGYLRMRNFLVYGKKLY